jgi:hypothetical protein
MLGGGLFSRYFLDTGVRTTAAWTALPKEDVAAFAAAARGNLSTFQTASAPNEAVTEERLIFPILRLLGWDLLPQQQATRRREDVPDALLFADATAAGIAMGRPVGSERYRLADLVHESKRWGGIYRWTGQPMPVAALRPPRFFAISASLRSCPTDASTGRC